VGGKFILSSVLPADASTRSALASAVEVRGNKSGRSGDDDGAESAEGGARARRDETVRRACQVLAMRVRSRPVIERQAREPSCVWLAGPMHHVIIKPGPLVGCPLERLALKTGPCQSRLPSTAPDWPSHSLAPSLKPASMQVHIPHLAQTAE
jgi:hypothetical protein